MKQTRGIVNLYVLNIVPAAYFIQIRNIQRKYENNRDTIILKQILNYLFFFSNNNKNKKVKGSSLVARRRTPLYLQV